MTKIIKSYFNYKQPNIIYEVVPSIVSEPLY